MRERVRFPAPFDARLEHPTTPLSLSLIRPFSPPPLLKTPPPDNLTRLGPRHRLAEATQDLKASRLGSRHHTNAPLQGPDDRRRAHRARSADGWVIQATRALPFTLHPCPHFRRAGLVAGRIRVPPRTYS